MTVVSKQVPRQSLTVVDNRTNKVYEIPIKNNSIQATDFKKIKAESGSDRKEDETEQGLSTHPLTPLPYFLYFISPSLYIHTFKGNKSNND